MEEAEERVGVWLPVDAVEEPFVEVVVFVVWGRCQALLLYG